MLENIGPGDRLVRLLLAIGLALMAVVWAGDLRLAAPAAFGAVWLAGTVLTRRCPVYRLLGLRSRRPATLSRRHAL